MDSEASGIEQLRRFLASLPDVIGEGFHNPIELAGGIEEVGGDAYNIAPRSGHDIQSAELAFGTVRVGYSYRGHRATPTDDC